MMATLLNPSQGCVRVTHSHMMTPREKMSMAVETPPIRGSNASGALREDSGGSVL